MTALRGGRSWGSKLHWQPVRLWYMIALTISRIWYLPWWPLTEGCAAFHAVITGSIRAHRSSDKSVAYGLRSLTRLSQHVHAHQPGITLQIHSITVRHHGHRLTDRPLKSVETDCGSHTLTLVPGRGADRHKNVYLYVSSYLPAPELPDCQPPHDKISIIKVPLRAPTQAHVAATPVVFPDGGNETQPGLLVPTTGCHDITAYP